MTADAAALLDVATRAARAGGAEVLARAGRPSGVRAKASPTDLVTDADRASAAAITAVLATGGDHPVLCEDGDPVTGDVPRRWVVDPLDGTANYVRGIAHWAVSIAFEERDGDGWRAVAGVVHDPVRGETFTAARGAGAWLDGRRLTVHDPVEAASALVLTEFSYDATTRAAQAATLASVLPRVADVRSTGSSALDLCWVAAGRCDGYYEDDLGRWDWAAGALVVTEAAGVATPWGTGVVAAGTALHDALTAIIGDNVQSPSYRDLSC